MKLHTIPPPVPVTRIAINKAGFKGEYITVIDTTKQGCINELKSLISKQNLSIFETGKKTSVTVRTALGKKNHSDAESFSFYGLNPQIVRDLILNHIK